MDSVLVDTVMSEFITGWLFRLQQSPDISLLLRVQSAAVRRELSFGTTGAIHRAWDDERLEAVVAGLAASGCIGERQHAFSGDDGDRVNPISIQQYRRLLSRVGPSLEHLSAPHTAEAAEVLDFLPARAPGGMAFWSDSVVAAYLRVLDALYRQWTWAGFERRTCCRCRMCFRSSGSVSHAHDGSTIRVHQVDAERLRYDRAKPGPDGNSPLFALTPLELLHRLAALVPPPRVHRHRYFGVLAPHSPLHAAVTALAVAATSPPPAPALHPELAAEPAHRRAARYAWALLLARIYEVFPLLCPKCGGELRIIAFITDPSTVCAILVHLGEPTAPPRIASARAPPLWEAAGAECVDYGRQWDPSAHPEPPYEFDQRIAW